MKWVDDARWLAKRLWSVRFAAIGVIWASAGAYWVAAPEAWRPALSEPVKWVIGVIGVALAAAPGLAALVDQPQLREQKAARANTSPQGPAP